MKLDILYRDSSSGLEEAKELIKGNTYITEGGTRVRYLGLDEDSLKFSIINTSPLKNGVNISEFEKPETALPLFWRMSAKNLSYEDSY